MGPGSPYSEISKLLLTFDKITFVTFLAQAPKIAKLHILLRSEDMYVSNRKMPLFYNIYKKKTNLLIKFSITVFSTLSYKILYYVHIISLKQ